MKDKLHIEWHYDPILTKDGSPSNSILYGESNNTHFTISSHPNRLLSKSIASVNLVYLSFIDKYHKEHLHYGTLSQMKSLAQQIVNNEDLFYKLQYLKPRYFRNYDGPEDIPIETLNKL